MLKGSKQEKAAHTHTHTHERALASASLGYVPNIEFFSLTGKLTVQHRAMLVFKTSELE